MKISNGWAALAVLGILAGAAAFGQAATWSGTVSDQMCGAKHMMAGGAAKCTRACVGMGSPYALVVGDKVYTLKGHAAELNHLAGEAVVVKGNLSGTTIDVSSVTAK